MEAFQLDTKYPFINCNPQRQKEHKQLGEKIFFWNVTVSNWKVIYSQKILDQQGHQKPCAKRLWNLDVLGQQSLGNELHWVWTCNTVATVMTKMHTRAYSQVVCASRSMRKPSQSQDPHVLLTSLSTRFVFINTPFDHYPLLKRKNADDFILPRK